MKISAPHQACRVDPTWQKSRLELPETTWETIFLDYDMLLLKKKHNIYAYLAVVV